MKRILLSLLTYGMYVSAFAQIDTSKKINPGNSDKWEIIKVNAKSSTGKLFVTLPKGTEWDMTIYAAGSDKVLSFTRFQQSFVLLPGSYDLEINHIKITAVPVEKGNNTRLKAGVLHITNSDSWWLYDETKEQVLLGGTSPHERGLPIGKYKLTIMGQDQDIEVKDETPGQVNTGIIENDKWVMTPIDNPGIKPGSGEMGAIDMSWPGVIEGVSYKTTVMDSIAPLNNIQVATCENGPCPEPFPLHEGKYNIYRQQQMEVIRIKDVPIRRGYETRLKMGFLHIFLPGDWRVVDSARQTTYSNGSDSNYNKKLFPVGVYLIANAGTWHRVAIKDKETVVLRPVPKKGKTEPLWVITPLPGEEREGENGRLDMAFPGDTSWTMSVYRKLIINETFKPDDLGKATFTFKTYSLPAGYYRIILNGVLIDSVPIQSGMKTRIKTGLLKLNFAYAPEVDPESVVDAVQPLWYTHPIERAYSGISANKRGPGSCSITLPVGKTGIKIFGTCPLDNIVIKDREVTSLDFKLGILIIRNPHDRVWVLEDICEGFPLFTIPYIGKSDIGDTLGLPIGNYKLTSYGESMVLKVTGKGSGGGKTYGYVNSGYKNDIRLSFLFAIQ